MMNPEVGVFSGTLTLGGTPHWQDYTALVLVLGSLATVLLPAQVARSKSAMRYSDDEGKFRRWMGPGNTRASLACQAI
jgi:hypothetical protein